MTNPILTLENVTIGYGGDDILTNISLTLPRGVFAGLLGSNGSGKTTLFKLISGEHVNYSGKIFFESKDISSYSVANRIAHGIIYIHQFPIVFPNLQAWETFMVWSSIIPGKKGYALTRESIITYLTIELLKAGLSIPFDKVVSELTEHELQILEFSRCFIIEPRLILIDETTSILDYKLSLKILSFLRSLCQKGVTVIFISHRLAELKKFSDHIFQLKEKKISAYQPSEEIGSYNIILKSVAETVTSNSPILDTQLNNANQIIPLKLYAGDILGFTGFQGDYYEHLPDLLRQQLIQSRTASNNKLRVGYDFAYLGKDRKKDWIFPLQSLKFNLSIASRGFIYEEDNFPLAATAQRYLIYPYDLKKAAIEFSGGNKLKIALARTLLLCCPINILDEPFTGVDAESREGISLIIKDDIHERNSAFIVFSKDYKELLKLCNRIIVFKNDGAWKELSSFSFEAIKDEALEEKLFN